MVSRVTFMAKTYHCWRCKIPVPMLDDAEWAEIHPLLGEDFKRIKQYCTGAKVGLSEGLATIPHGACERYLEITGFRATNWNSIWHHRLALHGPECPACGHLFRTPKAKFCANCGYKPDA